MTGSTNARRRTKEQMVQSDPTTFENETAANAGQPKPKATQKTRPIASPMPLHKAPDNIDWRPPRPRAPRISRCFRGELPQRPTIKRDLQDVKTRNSTAGVKLTFGRARNTSYRYATTLARKKRQVALPRSPRRPNARPVGVEDARSATPRTSAKTHGRPIGAALNRSGRFATRRGARHRNERPCDGEWALSAPPLCRSACFAAAW